MRRSRARLAAIAVVWLVVGQLASLAHEAGTRHITCAEHGEELEAATLVEQLHACEQDHLIGVESEHGGDHEDCAIARALHQSTRASHVALSLQLATTTAPPALPARATALRSIALYRIAPKTSPPDRLHSLFA